MATNKPRTIFKYQPLSIQTLINLQSQVIYFCSPSQLNDPYDCTISTRVKKLSHSEINSVREHYINDLDRDDPAAQELLSMGRLKLREMLQASLTQIAEQARLKFFKESGVACFTESNNNMLMWAHYADNGRGICLEFDTEFEPFTLMRKVKYVDSIPEINSLSALIKDDFDQFIDLYCTKSDHWKYEKEWRSLHDSAGTRFTYESNALKAVYFGPEVDKSVLNIVCLILHGQNPDVKLHTSKTRDDKFSIEFSNTSYLPWRYLSPTQRDSLLNNSDIAY